MAQVAPVSRPSISLSTILRAGWNRFVRSGKQAYVSPYNADVVFTDSLEREMNERELHHRGY